MIQLKPSDKTLEDLGWARLEDALAARAGSDLGVERCRERRFESDPAVVRDELGVLAEMLAARDEAGPVHLGGLRDIRQALVRVQKGGVLPGDELMRAAEDRFRASTAIRSSINVSLTGVQVG